MHQSSTEYIAGAGKDGARNLAPADPTNKKGSFKFLFSIFKSTKHSQRSNPENDRRSSSPARQKDRASENMLSSYEDPAASTISLSVPVSKTLSSSSSSTSSLEFESGASTAVTTPSNSVPSVLMKPADSMSSPDLSGISPGSLPIPKPPPRAVPDHQRPSPLSSKSLPAHSPYILPSPPPSPILHERRNSFQPQRRNSLGRLLARGYQSSPDILRPLDCGAISSMPRTPSSASLSGPSSSDSRTKSSRRREKGRADLEKPTSYSQQERIEHRSILGADPAGSGFYLYPKTSTQELSQKDSKVDYYGGSSTSGGTPGRNSWSGMSGDNASRRGWRDQRGRSFRGNVASQIIVEEEGGENYQEPPSIQTQRCRSEVPMYNGQWRQSRLEAGAVPPLPATISASFSRPSLAGGGLEGDHAGNRSTSPNSRRRSLHDRVERIRAPGEGNQAQLFALQIQPQGNIGEGRNHASELRRRQQGVVRLAEKVCNDECGNVSTSRHITEKLEGIVQVPALRIGTVDA